RKSAVSRERRGCGQVPGGGNTGERNGNTRFSRAVRFPRKGAWGGRVLHPAITLCLCRTTMRYVVVRFRRAGRGVRHRSPPAERRRASASGVIDPFERHTPVPSTHDPGRGGAAWTLSPQHFCSASGRPSPIDPRPWTGGRGWAAAAGGLLVRIGTAESDLSRARDEGDEFLVEVERGELEDLRRLAAEHGVEVGLSGI